ncbi:MAG: glutaredoxin [Pseudomonadales bacterium]|nr:glutaredoxin [Pseudomonadales bacterium]
MPEVVIYTKNWCGFCHAAKALLDQLKVPYQEIDVTNDRTRYVEMVKKAAGRTSVPQIFIDGKGIGGYTDLDAMVRRSQKS